MPRKNYLRPTLVSRPSGSVAPRLRPRGQLAATLHFLRLAGSTSTPAYEVSRLADEALQSTRGLHRLRPAILLGAARVYHFAGDSRAVVTALEEFFSLHCRWLRSETNQEVEALEWFTTALWRVGRKTEVIALADQAAILTLLTGQTRAAVHWLRYALHAGLILSDPGAETYLRRLAELIPATEPGAEPLAAALAVDRAWLCLARGEYRNAVRLAQGQWENPAADGQVRAQALWVVAEAAFHLGLAEAAEALHKEATRLAVAAGWEWGLRLCSGLAARMAAGNTK